MTVTHPHLLVEQRDKLCWITFNRPEKLNCFSDDMLDTLVVLLDELEGRRLGKRDHLPW